MRHAERRRNGIHVRILAAEAIVGTRTAGLDGGETRLTGARRNSCNRLRRMSIVLSRLTVRGAQSAVYAWIH